MEWKRKFATHFKKQPLYTHAYAFDMADMVISAANALGDECSSQNLEKALMSLDKQGITGRLKFDEQGDLVPSVEIGVFRDGKVVPNTR